MGVLDVVGVGFVVGVGLVVGVVVGVGELDVGVPVGVGVPVVVGVGELDVGAGDDRTGVHSGCPAWAAPPPRAGSCVPPALAWVVEGDGLAEGAIVPANGVAGVLLTHGIGAMPPGSGPSRKRIQPGGRPEIGVRTPAVLEPEAEPEREPLAPGDRWPEPSAWPLRPAPPGPPGRVLLAWLVTVARSSGTAKVTATTSSSAPAAASIGRSQAAAE